MYTEKDENENYGVNQEAIDKLNFFGIILGEDIDNGNKYENGFIMIDSMNETVKMALRYANQIIEDLVKNDDYKSYPIGRLKQQTVYQIYPYFFEYLFICLIINDEKLNLKIEDYRYIIEINMEGDFLKEMIN